MQQTMWHQVCKATLRKSLEAPHHQTTKPHSIQRKTLKDESTLVTICVSVDTPSAKTAQRDTIPSYESLGALPAQTNTTIVSPGSHQQILRIPIIDQADVKNRTEAFSKPGCPLSSCNNVKVQLGARRLALMFASCLPLSPKVSHSSASHPSFNERWHQGERIN